MRNTMPQGNRPRNSQNSQPFLPWLLIIISVTVIVGVSLFAVFQFGLFNGGKGPGSPGQGTQTVLTPTLPAGTDISANFGSRQNHSFPIPSTLFGFNGLKKTDSANSIFTYIKQAHIDLARIGVDMSVNFPTSASLSNASQQQWSDLDQQLSQVQSQGLHPIVTLAYTPTWLQPQAALCPSGISATHVMPTLFQNGTDAGVTIWGQLAALVVAHIDQKFPGVHPAYEIWNEPDGTNFLCVPNNSQPQAEQTKLQQYEAIYSAAASQMEQQAQRDNVQIEIGGPALAFPRGHAKMWISALVNDPGVAQYLDFISYHHYLFPGSNDTWDKLLARTQSGSIGVAAEYEQIAAIVRAGKQPNPQSTPILIDEYNTNTGPSDCCRLDPTYGPLWNALFVADLLNIPTDPQVTNAASLGVVGGLAYFSIVQPPPSDQFCMFGSSSGGTNCNLTGNIQPYPQFYTYELLGDSSYLDISNGGYMVASSTQVKGLVVCSFYTGTKDNILIINTTGTNYASLGVVLQTPGSIQTTASLYTLNQEHPQIGSQQIGLVPTTNGYKTGVAVPAFSTVALSVNVAG